MDTAKLFRFMETPGFTAKWHRLGLLDEDLSALQLSIRDDPQVGAVIGNAGGFRKVRFAQTGRGKSGGFRVIYLPLIRLGTVILGVVYAKNEKSDLNAAEKKMLARLAIAYESAIEIQFKRNSK